MSLRSQFRAPGCPLAVGAVLIALSSSSLAQEADHQQDAGGTEHRHGGVAGIPMTRDGSGTSWLADESPVYARHHMAGGWMLMLHSNVFLQCLEETGDRGSDQVGSINWVMGMASHNAAGGQMSLRAMLSAEPATIDGCGYPN